MVQGDTVPVGDCTLQVIALAGHTPGSIALLYDDSASEGGHPHLFTGDSLFPGGVGNTFGDSDAFAQLLDEVSTKIFDQLPDDTWFYPGHGNDSTLGAERPHLGGVARQRLVRSRSGRCPRRAGRRGSAGPRPR